jgi:hypothetical protein
MDSQDQQPQSQENKPLQSDAKKLADKHMADPNHIITDEDLQNIEVGKAPPPDAPTQEAIQESDDRVADRKAESDDDTLPGSQKMTPWDVVD